MNRKLFQPSAQDREFRLLFDDMDMVWAEQIPAEMVRVHGHECQRMYDVLRGCAGGDGLPRTELRAMEKCNWCGVQLPSCQVH